MIRNLVVILMITAVSLTSDAGHWLVDSITTEGHIGYNIGGTAPIGMPATIRHLDKYELTPSLRVGVSVTKRLSSRWGLRAGLQFENKGMKTDARVKNYKMEMVKGGEVLGGVFTGNVVTRTGLWMFTIPIQATCKLSHKVSLRAGVYGSYLTGRFFDGWAYDGYLRVDDPTGLKVQLGHDAGERGDYDFNSNLRHWQWGVGAGVDWYFHRRLGLYGELNWGMSGAFKSDFKTIEQTMHPIYGSIGLTYRLH